MAHNSLSLGVMFSEWERYGMCGIAGVLNFKGCSPSRESIGRMVRAIRHRGPDGHGVHIDGPVGFGHARLSIIDLETGQQPMQSADGTLTLVFNGEIFNYIELRQSLEDSHGRVFRTSSDTEVLLHLYDLYGPAMVDHLNGQWALALWDARRRHIFLSRDRVGVRPLHYVRDAQQFIFCSEIKGILAHGHVSFALNPHGLADTLNFWTPLPGETIFKGVHELPPGCSMLIDESGRQGSMRHWSWDYSQPRTMFSDPEMCSRELLHLLRDAVRLRLRADVSVGAYLSGGLDSSLITTLCAMERGASVSTFSIVFEDPEYDESPFQNKMARDLGSDHHVVHCSLQDVGDAFENVVWHAERPLVRTAPAPMMLLSKLVRDHGYKVVLTGEGADEVFGGYDLFREVKVRQFIARHPKLGQTPALIQSLYPFMPQLKAQPPDFVRLFFGTDAGVLDDPFYPLRPRLRLTQKLQGLLHPQFRASLGEHDSLSRAQKHLPAGYAGWNPVEKAQYLEATILMPGYILSSQGDRMSMAHGVEGRFPFLDARVLEFGAKLPSYLRLLGLKEKWILKKAASSILPQEIVARPKQPYRAPDVKSLFMGRSASGEPLLERLRPERIARAGVFEPRIVGSFVQRLHEARSPPSVRDGMALTTLISTQILYEQYIAR